MTKIAISNQSIMQLNKVAKLIGNTPLYSLDNFYKKKNVKIFAKLEWNQLGGSIKARPAFNIIKHAIINNQINNKKSLIDATSGNTGIAYAAIGAALGIKVVLAIPENASKERLLILKSLGAKLILTSKFEGTDGAQNVVKELVNKNPDKYFYADQYANNFNWLSHYNHTSFEIFKQTNSRITHFVNGLGTTGTFVGVSRRFKEIDGDIKNISLQPNNPLHGLEGWKHLETAVVPKIYDATIADRNLYIDTLETYDMIKNVSKKEGLILSPSSAANLVGAIRIAEEIDSGIIVTTFADDSSKYSEIINKILN